MINLSDIKNSFITLISKLGSDLNFLKSIDISDENLSISISVVFLL